MPPPNYKYTPQYGGVFTPPDTINHSLWNSQAKPQGIWDRIMGNSPQMQYSFANDGLSFLKQVGFKDEFLKNPAFQQYMFENKFAIPDPKTGALTLPSGLDATKINQIQTDFTNGIQTGTIDSATGKTLNGSSNELFGWGKNEAGQTTFGGATGLQWIGAGLGAATSLYGMYNAHKSMKLARENFEEQKALNRANFTNQAKGYNNSLRNQQSGRSFTGMSGSARRTLGREYNSKKVSEQYW